MKRGSERNIQVLRNMVIFSGENILIFGNMLNIKKKNRRKEMEKKAGEREKREHHIRRSDKEAGKTGEQ